MNRPCIAAGTLGFLPDEIQSRIRNIDPRIDPFVLKEIVLNKLLQGKEFSSLSRGEKRVIEFRVQLELQFDLDKYIIRLSRELNSQSLADGRKEIVLETEKEYRGLIDFPEEGDSIQDRAVVDQPVSPGKLTALHLAAACGDLEKVIELVEKQGALIDITDAYGLTAMVRADMMGQTKVATYLRGRQTKFSDSTSK